MEIKKGKLQKYYSLGLLQLSTPQIYLGHPILCIPRNGNSDMISQHNSKTTQILEGLG